MSHGRYGGLLAMLLLAACGRTPDDRHFTVEYYRAHAAERLRILRECANDPGDLSRAPECVNAREAARIEDVGSLRNLPPMGLPTSPDPKTNGAGPR